MRTLERKFPPRLWGRVRDGGPAKPFGYCAFRPEPETAARPAVPALPHKRGGSASARSALKFRPIALTHLRWVVVSSALALSSGAAFAECSTTDFGGVVAAKAETCNFFGSHSTSVDNQIAAEARGLGILNAGPDESGTLSYSTSGISATAVQADSGGSVTLTPSTEIAGTVSTTGAGSIGLNATNSDPTETVFSNLSATNVNVSTQGSNAKGVQADTGAKVTLNGGFVSTTGAGSIGLYATNGKPVGNETVFSNLSATNVNVSTHGSNANGVRADSGAKVTLNGGLVSTTGAGSIGLYATNGKPVGNETVFSNLSATNVNVSTQGSNANGVQADSGAKVTLNGGLVSTTGAGSIGLYATGFGTVINATGAETITTAGGVSSATGLGAYGVDADGAGSRVQLGAATVTTSGAGATALFSSGSAGSITVSGTLNVKTMNAAAAAVGLQGNGASILATGGGTIVSAGDAIEFLGGTNQTATFDNFTINNQTGDLIFADPSVATINFNSTIASAGLNNLLDATNGSDITLNASASKLTGAIQTDSTSTTNVNLTNRTIWTMTGSSTVTNLSVVTNSVVVFAPPGSGVGFKTLTVTNYVGSGANITMNATLGGPTTSADQIIVNGGKATGFTSLTINNFGGLGGPTSGAGIPLVIATNGGTVAPGAFALANTPIAGGFRYMLEESNNDWYLVSTPAPTLGQVESSINQVPTAQRTQIITNQVLNSILLGATQQISSCSCAGGFASVGSFAAGAQGRWGLSDELSLIGGFSYNQWYASGISVENAPTVAGALIYDLWKWGESRPFFEVAGALTPYEDVHSTRYYANGLTTGVGNASAIDRDLSLFARAGWVDRLSSVDEAAVYGDLGRSWMQTGGYTETTSALNPFPATVSNGLDTLNVARLGGQLTHLFNGNIEANVSAAVAYGFGAGKGAPVSVNDFGPIAPNALPNTTWMEYGARIGYRFNDRLVIDAFVVGTAFGEVGTTVHGGIGLRYAF